MFKESLHNYDGLTQEFPQWHFTNKINLKCLAARAILKHEVMYKQVLPSDLVTFVELHSYPGLRRRRAIQHKAEMVKRFIEKQKVTNK